MRCASDLTNFSGGIRYARAFVQIEFRTFVAKDILPIIGAERSCVFPLRINRSIPFANRDPSILAGGNAGALVRFLEPRHDTRRFRPVTIDCLVVVWEGAVKRVLSRGELYRNVIAAMRGIWIVKSAVTSAPIFVPGAPPVRHRIVSARLLADPKDSCHNIFLPRIAPSCGRGTVFSA